MANLGGLHCKIAGRIRTNVGTTVHCPLCKKLLKIGGPLKNHRNLEDAYVI